MGSSIDDLRAELASYTPNNFKERLGELHDLLANFRKARVEIDIERALWYTRTLKAREKSNEPMGITRARAMKAYMQRRTIAFPDGNLLAGGSTGKLLGAPLYPEFLTGMGIWPELDTIGERAFNPQALGHSDSDTLNFEILPYWMDRTIVERVRPLDEDGIDLLNRMVIYTISKAAVISHTTPSYRMILEKGARAMIAEATTRAARALTKKEADYHRSAAIALESLIVYAARLAREARRRAKAERSASGKAEWLAMADVLDRVPEKPARTFREAVNSLWITHAGILAESSNMALNPGRIDQILLPYFRADRAAGRLSVDEALKIAGCLWLKLGDNVNLVPEAAERLFGGAGAVPAVTLGGVDAEGKDAVNELTWLFLKVTELMPIRDPNVNARVHRLVNPREYRDEVARVILSTRAIPAVYNDEANVAALVSQGQTTEHARDYAVVGCVELASAGRDFSASSSLFIMLYTVLYMALHNGRTPVTKDRQVGPATGEVGDLAGMEGIWKAFEIQLEWMALRTTGLNNLFGEQHRQWLPTPLLSAVFEGTAEKGRDVVDGGAVYNASGVTIIGFADVVDSISAIEDVCFNPDNHEMHLDPASFVAKVDADWAGDTRLFAYCRNMAPKYGTSNERAARNASRVVDLVYRAFNGKKNYRDGNYRVAYWTMTNHAGYGSVTQATPNGRRAKEVFSSGITPVSQLEIDAATEFQAVARLAGDKIPGAYALNMKFSPAEASPEMAGKLASFFETYFEKGGQQAQFNFHDYRTLQAIKDDPKGNDDVLVRVSGYSAWFKSLNPHMKDELIRRSQYDLSNGAFVPLSPSASPAEGAKEVLDAN